MRGFGDGKGSALVSDIAAVDVVPADMWRSLHVRINEMSNCIICPAVTKGVVEDVEVSPVGGHYDRTDDTGGDRDGPRHEIEDYFHLESCMLTLIIPRKIRNVKIVAFLVLSLKRLLEAEWGEG